MTIQELFKTLGLMEEPPGGCLSSARWSRTTDAGIVESHNPSTGEPLARVYGCSLADYDALIAGSQQAQASWRMVPAPKRGEVIRLIGQALRDHKDALGTLVSFQCMVWGQ